MSFIFLQEQVVESSAGCFSDIPASVLSRSSHTAEMSCCNGNGTDCFRDSPSGTTFARSTELLGGVESMSSAEDFHVKTFPSQGKGKAFKAIEADFGQRWHELFVKYDLSTSSWKTRRCLFDEDLPWSSVTLPKWGSMLNGELYRLPTLGRRISEKDFGLWASTPTRVMPLEKEDPNERTAKIGRKVSKSGIEGSANWCQNVLQLGVVPTPDLCEFYMGWPIGWTDLQPLEMDKFRLWLQSHGSFLEDRDE